LVTRVVRRRECSSPQGVLKNAAYFEIFKNFDVALRPSCAFARKQWDRLGSDNAEADRRVKVDINWATRSVQMPSVASGDADWERAFGSEERCDPVGFGDLPKDGRECWGPPVGCFKTAVVMSNAP
jgi:hypothetical protein